MTTPNKRAKTYARCTPSSPQMPQTPPVFVRSLSPPPTTCPPANQALNSLVGLPNATYLTQTNSPPPPLFITSPINPTFAGLQPSWYSSGQSLPIFPPNPIYPPTTPLTSPQISNVYNSFTPATKSAPIPPGSTSCTQSSSSALATSTSASPSSSSGTTYGPVTSSGPTNSSPSDSLGDPLTGVTHDSLNDSLSDLGSTSDSFGDDSLNYSPYFVEENYLLWRSAPTNTGETPSDGSPELGSWFGSGF